MTIWLEIMKILYPSTKKFDETIFFSFLFWITNNNKMGKMTQPRHFST